MPIYFIIVHPRYSRDILDRLIIAIFLYQKYCKFNDDRYISRFHNQELILGALQDALSRNSRKVAIYFHSDQGSEYDAEATTTFVITLGMIVSMSDKASPRQNGFQESFYSQFKVDLGNPNRFETLGELIEAIHLTINYYNTKRRHTTLKTTPENYRLTYFKNRNRIAV